jgi:hypothetical protein
VDRAQEQHEDVEQIYEPYRGEWEWGNDAMLDWDGGHDDSFLHYEPDHEAEHAAAAHESDRSSDDHESDIEILPTDTDTDIATDTDPDIPLAGASASRRARTSVAGAGLGSKVPKKRALIDLTGSSGEIAVTTPTVESRSKVSGPVTPERVGRPTPPRVSTRRSQWQSATETETDASSVAPEDAGLEPEMMYEENGDDGYGGMGVDEWADWGHDAYLVYDADEGAADRDGGLESEASGDTDGHGGAGDTTLTISTLPILENDTPTTKSRHTSRDKSKGKARAVETVDDLLARGMPDYSSWSLKRLQVSHRSHSLSPATDVR